MKLNMLRVENCRNIKCAEIVPDHELTVIAGKNGQGKTNLLECIWLLTGSKSFRSAKDIELVNEKEIFGRIVAETIAKEKENRIELLIQGAESLKRGRSAKVNGVDYGRATAIAGIFTAVVFEPDHLRLIKAGPEGRRRFLDAALCQLYPGYISIIRRFTRALTQKNALLKKYRFISDADNLLDVFDEEISITGEEITKRRNSYLQTLAPLSAKFYEELSQGAESLKIEFRPCCKEKEFKQMLINARNADIKTGYSTSGPQREDFEPSINERSAKIFGSQGQQRSTALSLKLAEAAVAKKITGEHPVMLLDDVLSELDETRQSYLLSRMGGKQCIVTTCDASAFKRTAGKIYKVKNGVPIII